MSEIYVVKFLHRGQAEPDYGDIPLFVVKFNFFTFVRIVFYILNRAENEKKSAEKIFYTGISSG